MPTEIEQLARLAIAAVLGGVIGAERELSDQPAGLRTHILLTVGACLFTLISAYGFGPNSDPSRLAAQIVTGVGFLGGGAILRHGITIRGLTTAASIWATCAVGVAVGVGSYVLAVGATVLVLAALVGLRAIRNVLRNYAASREELTVLTDPDFQVEKLTQLLHREGVSVRGLQREVGADGGGRVQLVAKLPARYRAAHLVEEIAALDGVREVEWEG
jgi:putative Mg2+ transporter-C (MgtC) family protein